jgi:hypothetical protein
VAGWFRTMIEALVSADHDWSCRWCRSRKRGESARRWVAATVRSASLADRSEPDPQFPLIMVMCTDCRLVPVGERLNHSRGAARAWSHSTVEQAEPQSIKQRRTGTSDRGITFLSTRVHMAALD